QWRPGREAVSHEILLSMDPAAVQDGSALVAIANENTYAPDPLIYGTTYTWQVNEIYEAEEYSSYLGDPWTFTTPEYAVIDNFDQYDNDCERIFFTWLDGWGHNGAADCGIAPFAGNGTGAVVGNLDAPFAEKRIVKSGSALSLTYDNSMSPFYSEVESAAFALPSDWTPGAAQTLSLSFRGRPVGFRENTDGSITMSGMGADIADTTDEGHFAYRELTGDGTITVRLDSLQDVRDSTKAGVMIRETLFPWSKNVYLSGTPRNLTQFQYRGATAGNTVEIASSENATPLPVWLRLTRAGRVFTAQRSQDGVNWESITTDESASRTTITMCNPLYVGLAVTSHDIEIPAVAEFSHVSFSGQVSDRWQLEAMTVEQVSNDPESIYLGIADDRGGIAVITHPDPAATQIATWTEWRIPMSHFVAVDLSNVQKVFLGVGDRDNPTSGGKGKLYIEDIRIGTPLPLAEDAYPSLE
ncbi:MAG: hypothetical protein IH892_20665, partial [Planctomycetes bacterium]|nr:hypothetical protein [Planctomycetota bacterium]